MSNHDYSTIARTPLNQLHQVPLGDLVAYLSRCSTLTRRAVDRALNIHTKGMTT